MLFKNVIGQNVVKNKLLHMVSSGKIPHALMLLGPEGCGGLALALALAQYIQCTNRTESDSCGECASCRKCIKFIHPDIHFTFPVVPKKSGVVPVGNDYVPEWRNALTANPYMNANDWLQNIGAENRQGNITVKECHEIIRGMSMTTLDDGYKIQVIWLAEYLKEAGNTLLKVIEEPPANTLFILVVENIEMVLTTVISRTQIVKVNAIEDVEIKNELMSRFEITEDAASNIARICNGNFNAALSYSSGVENVNDRLLYRWLVICFNIGQKNSAANVSNCFNWVEEISKIGRENQKIFLKYALFFLRECNLIAVTGNSNKLEGEELKFAVGLSSKLQAEQLHSVATVINDLYYSIERNGNPKILFVSTTFKIASAFNQPLVTV